MFCFMSPAVAKDLNWPQHKMDKHIHKSLSKSSEMYQLNELNVSKAITFILQSTENILNLSNDRCALIYYRK